MTYRRRLSIASSETERFFFSGFPAESEYTNVRWGYRLSRSLLTLFSRLIDSNRISYYGYDIIKVSSAAQRFCTIITLLEHYPILSGNYIYGNYIIYIFMPILHNHVLTFNPSSLDKIWNNEISQTLKFLHFYNIITRSIRKIFSRAILSLRIILILRQKRPRLEHH